MNRPILSIYVPTYNHENYIEQALDSILMQKTEYTYEILVGEDCSTDHTRAVLKRYENQHPGKFNIFYREHNMRNEHFANASDLKKRCHGKYIIALEGDDYWTDPYKIDKQIRFLEEHPEYIAVSHRCTVVGKDSNPLDEKYPECIEPEYSLKQYANGMLPGQLTTVMYRNIYYDPQFDTTLLFKKLTPGDQVIYFWLLMNGKVYRMDENMSAYRHVTQGGSSWSATTTYKFDGWNRMYIELVNYSRKKGNREAEMYAEFLCLANLVRGFKHGQCGMREVTSVLRTVKHLLRVCCLYIKFRVNRDILNRKLAI